MKIILHADETCEIRSRLMNQVEDELPEVQIALTNSKQDLSEALCRPLHNFSVLICFIDDSESVELLISLKPLFENIKLILIHSKRVEDIRKDILKLEPSFISASENFTDIIFVLQHIEQKQSLVIHPSGIKQWAII